MVAVVACSARHEPRGADGSAAGAPAAKAKPATHVERLGTLALEADVPDGARIDDRTRLMPDDGGAPDACVIVRGRETQRDLEVCIINDVYPVQPPDACLKCWAWLPGTRTLPDEQRSLRAEDPNLAFTKQETTPDGWLIEYRRSVQGYGIAMRRTINNSPWMCTAHVPSLTELDDVEQLCRSLRPPY